MTRPRKIRRPRFAAGAREKSTRAGGPRAGGGRRPKSGAPLAPSGSLADVLKVQAESSAALRAVRMPMAVEPSFIFKP